MHYLHTLIGDGILFALAAFGLADVVMFLAILILRAGRAAGRRPV